MTRQTRSHLAPGTAGIAAFVAMSACLFAGWASAAAAAHGNLFKAALRIGVPIAYGTDSASIRTA